MKVRLFAPAVVAAGLAGCATDYVPPPPVNKPGPEWSDRQVPTHRGPGMFGDLTWTLDSSGKRQSASSSQDTATAASAAEQEDFKKWRESMSPAERQEFEDWRAWQEWKRKNPK